MKSQKDAGVDFNSDNSLTQVCTAENVTLPYLDNPESVCTSSSACRMLEKKKRRFEEQAYLNNADRNALDALFSLSPKPSLLKYPTKFTNPKRF